MHRARTYILFFFFNDTATTEIYTLSLHDALPICAHAVVRGDGDLIWQTVVADCFAGQPQAVYEGGRVSGDRKSTRLNSSHSQISYAVFCLKKKKKKKYTTVSLSAAIVLPVPCNSD